MLKSVEGVYRDGKIEFLEPPGNIEETRVIVTFLPAQGPVDLRSCGIDEAQARSLRHRLEAVAEDWERPEMEAYDAL